MTKIIGLTGGIGSGKTSVAKCFEKHGIKVFISDDSSRKILSQPETLFEIRQNFGQEVFDGDVLNKTNLSKIVFNDSNKLKILNEIIHPKVRNDFQNWLMENQNEKFVLYESAILFESGGNLMCDKIISVNCPEEIRILRVVERDKTTIEAVKSRIKNQISDEKRIEMSDFVIINIDFVAVEEKVIEIIKILNNA